MVTRDILQLIKSNFLLLLQRLILSIKAKERPTTKSQCIFKDTLSELRLT